MSPKNENFVGGKFQNFVLGQFFTLKCSATMAKFLGNSNFSNFFGIKWYKPVVYDNILVLRSVIRIYRKRKSRKIRQWAGGISSRRIWKVSSTTETKYRGNDFYESDIYKLKWGASSRLCSCRSRIKWPSERRTQRYWFLILLSK